LGQNNKESNILNLKVTPNIQTATDCTIFFQLCSEKASLSQVQQLKKFRVKFSEIFNTWEGMFDMTMLDDQNKTSLFNQQK
jgi:hypothetical protein